MGTMSHRLWDCPCLQDTRSAVLPTHLRGQRLGHQPLPGHAGYDPLSHVGVVLARGLGTVSIDGIPAHPDASFTWNIFPSGGLCASTFYTDGSGMDRDPIIAPYCQRYAWSFVALRDGAKQAAAHGSAPAWTSSVFTAELWAILQAALVPSLGPLTIYTDCLSAVRAWETGALSDEDASDLHAGIWRGIKGATLDRDFVLIWIPAHLGEEDIGVALRSDGVTLTRSDLYGNRIADKLATSAARASRVPDARVQRLRRDLDKVLDSAKAVASLCMAASTYPLSSSSGSVLRDALPRRSREKKPVTPIIVQPQLGCHSVAHVGGRYPWRCLVCARSSCSRPRLQASACGGPPSLQLESFGHRIVIIGAITWCSVCGV